MSAPFGMYGGYKRESTESRALGSITSDSYDYRDQAKFLSKMAGDVSYMAAYMRKMQRGIDSANENFIQQIQSLLNDFMVLLAGNGDTGLDFGDLKYVLQAIGALFGFGDGPLPINLFAAAWHFFSTYILPVSNFQEAIEMIVDGLIAGVLDLFGEVPIVGQALQQFAVILSELRDIVMPLLEAVQGLFDAIGYAFDDDLGPFGDLMTALNKAFGAITEPVAEALAPLLAILATWTAPLMDGLTYIVQAVTNIINTLTNGIHDIQYYAESGFEPLQMLLDIIETLIDNGILAVLDAGNIVGTLLASVIPALDASKIVSGIFNALQIPNLDAGKIVSGIFNALRIPGLDASKITSGQFAQAMVNITSIAANWITGVLNSLNIPSLDASKITSGQFSQSLIQNLGADLGTIDDKIQETIDSVIAGAGNLIGEGFDIADMIAQLTGLRQAATGANDAVLDLQAQVANLDPAASSEVVKFVEFADAASPPSMFTKVNDIGTGNIIVSAGELKWNGTDAGREFYIFNGGPLLTDLFEVTFVLPSVPSHGWFGADGSNYLYLIGRSDSTGSNMVLARLAWDEIRVYSYNSGTFTQIGPTISDPDILTGGCKVSFKGGTVAEPRYFKVSVNGNKLYEATDSVPVSLFGADKRFCGLGIEKGSSYLTGTISTWSMLDGGASAGSGVVAGYTASGLTNLNLWKGTASQYAAITTKNPNTIYVVT